MAMPKSVTKIDKNGVTFIDNVDAVMYTLEELSRAALRDTGKLLRRAVRENIPKRTGTLRANVATWNKKGLNGEPPSLQVGVYTPQKAKEKGITPAYHARLVQFGTGERVQKSGKPTGSMPATPYLDTATYNNIDKIRDIQAQYLSAVADANRLIDENEEIADD
jgi:HK97 gp10 family phage protein